MATISADDPLTAQLARAIDDGSVEALLAERPEIVSVRVVDGRGCERDALHLLLDWPGGKPRTPETIRALVAAGADPNSPLDGGSACPTPWPSGCGSRPGGWSSGEPSSASGRPPPSATSTGYGRWPRAPRTRTCATRCWCAGHGGQPDTARFLPEQGADPRWVGHDGLTAAGAARRRGATDLADRLDAVAAAADG